MDVLDYYRSLVGPYEDLISDHVREIQKAAAMQASLVGAMDAHTVKDMVEDASRWERLIRPLPDSYDGVLHGVESEIERFNNQFSVHMLEQATIPTAASIMEQQLNGRFTRHVIEQATMASASILEQELNGRFAGQIRERSAIAAASALEQQALIDQVTLARRLEDTNMYAEALWANLPYSIRDAISAARSYIDMDVLDGFAHSLSSQMYDYLAKHSIESIEDLDSAFDESDIRREVSERLRLILDDSIEKLEQDVADGRGPFQDVKSRKLHPYVQATLYLIASAIVSWVVGHFLDGLKQEYVAQSSKVQPASETKPGVRVSTEVDSLRLVFAKKDLTLRQGPMGSYAPMSSVPSGHFLIVERRKAGWVRVFYVIPGGDGASVRGWVRAKNVTPVALEVRRLILEAMQTEDMDDEDGLP